SPSTTGPAYATPTDEDAYEPKKEADMRGLTVTLGGGVEGYTQALAPAVSPGPSVAVNATLRPSKVLGLELGYSGAVNEIKQEDNVSGADIVRNGGQAAVTLGLNAASVQPYVLGGIGISSYNVRDESSARFQDDTVGSVPVGAGLRTHVGNFTADARVGYNFLFDQEFARNTPTSDVGGDDVEFSKSGRYNATLNFGTTF
ncbi:MAG TPA: outer membrane beta-barrel protein, partial [Aggregicoccus sp.]|nr:outer membrane beta-barrel protein [Aggregicoccus sp.]